MNSNLKPKKNFPMRDWKHANEFTSGDVLGILINRELFVLRHGGSSPFKLRTDDVHERPFLCTSCPSSEWHEDFKEVLRRVWAAGATHAYIWDSANLFRPLYFGEKYYDIWIADIRLFMNGRPCAKLDKTHQIESSIIIDS